MCCTPLQSMELNSRFPVSHYSSVSNSQHGSSINSASNSLLLASPQRERQLLMLLCCGIRAVLPNHFFRAPPLEVECGSGNLGAGELPAWGKAHLFCAAPPAFSPQPSFGSRPRVGNHWIRGSRFTGDQFSELHVSMWKHFNFIFF